MARTTAIVRRTACPLLAIAAIAALSTAGAGFDTQRGNPQGIWKSVVPPKGMKGEFEGHDPIGLAAHARIKADCSINWRDPDDGKLYCFSSATSLNYFLDWPKRNARRARKFWDENALTQ